MVLLTAIVTALHPATRYRHTGNDRYWHKADTHFHLQTSMTYLLRKLCLSLANNQTVCAGGKHYRALNRDNSEAHYSLLISLHVPETNVDLLIAGTAKSGYAHRQSDRNNIMKKLMRFNLALN